MIRHTTNPIWNQSIVFGGLSWDEEIMVEIKTVKKFTVNEQLCSFTFKIRDMMTDAKTGGIDEDPLQSFTLTGERAHAMLHAIFEFDPPVRADRK